MQYIQKVQSLTSLPPEESLPPNRRALATPSVGWRKRTRLPGGKFQQDSAASPSVERGKPGQMPRKPSGIALTSSRFLHRTCTTNCPRPRKRTRTCACLSAAHCHPARVLHAAEGPLRKGTPSVPSPVWSALRTTSLPCSATPWSQSRRGRL